MSSYQQKEGDIVIYAVKEKTNEKGPDWTGKALINGEEKQISLWFKSETMLAGSIKEKFKPGSAQPKKAERKEYQNINEDDSEIPF